MIGRLLFVNLMLLLLWCIWWKWPLTPQGCRLLWPQAAARMTRLSGDWREDLGLWPLSRRTPEWFCRSVYQVSFSVGIGCYSDFHALWVCVWSDASWEPGDGSPSIAGVGSAQELAGQVSPVDAEHAYLSVAPFQTRSLEDVGKVWYLWWGLYFCRLCLLVFSLRFRDAFECMRKLRINLNFIYDHNPKVRRHCVTSLVCLQVFVVFVF